jgi:glycosyltransferase involved in cell wall biosynthesis
VPRAKLSVTIVAQDEEDRLEPAIRSVDWADEVLVVDGGSTDRTPELARGAGARVIDHPWRGYAAQKNVAREAATHDWVLGLDADERVSPELGVAIRGALANPGQHHGFACNRRNHYLGRPIRWCGWYPDRRVRLFHRRHAAWVGPDPHDTVDVDGSVGPLDGDLLHDSYRSLADHRRAIERLAASWAASAAADGRRTRPWDLTLRPAAHFLKNYLLRLGFLEGRAGVLICAMGALHVFTKYRELGRTR